MRVMLTMLLAAVVLTGPASAAAQGSSGGWRLMEARDGIIVFRQFHEQSRLETFRGVMQMELADEYAMLALYNDVDAFPDWLHLIQGAEEISRKGPLNRNLRFVIDLPWPVRDREAVVNARQIQITRENEESVVTTLRARPDLVEPNDDYLRIPQLHGIFKLERIEPETVEVTFQVRLNMGGWIPNWLVNTVLRDMPWHTLDNLREVVRREEYQNQYFAYLDLFGPGRPDHLAPPRSWVYDTVDQASGTQTAGNTETEPVEPSAEDKAPGSRDTMAENTQTGSTDQGSDTGQKPSGQQAAETRRSETREQTAAAP